MDLTQLAGLSGIPVVVGIVEVLKNNIPTMTSAATVGCAFVASELWTVGTAYVLHTDIPTAALVAVIVWVSSMGSYSGAKSLLGK